MNLPDLAFKTSATLLGVATLILGADLVHAMTKEALVGKTPVSQNNNKHDDHFNLRRTVPKHQNVPGIA